MPCKQGMDVGIATEFGSSADTLSSERDVLSAFDRYIDQEQSKAEMIGPTQDTQQPAMFEQDAADLHFADISVPCCVDQALVQAMTQEQVVPNSSSCAMPSAAAVALAWQQSRIQTYPSAPRRRHRALKCFFLIRWVSLPRRATVIPPLQAARCQARRESWVARLELLRDSLAGREAAWGEERRALLEKLREGEELHAASSGR
eukprot:6214189-Pleurochrysis_carterae.AAC.1